MSNHSTIPTSPGGDPLLVSLLLALALHALFILGLGFSPEEEEPLPEQLPTLDITLVQKTQGPPPEEADYLAAHNQDGAGNVSEKIKPRLAQEARMKSAPPPEPAPPTPQVLTREQAPTRVQQTELAPRPAEKRPKSAAELINRSLELASLDEQLKQSLQAYSKRPRQTFISARTREFKYANYMNDWVAKVERVGNLNYPDAARRQHLSGNLLLDVALNPDGSIYNISVLRSSGHKILDDAAVRIVRLAAPFPPLPGEIRKDTDILHITRTWEFLSSGLQSR
ncbi:energy transducer TonB [Thiohalobacter sp. IOR34]|uniref:energy transducer TonB n=1 Tax=Thiohalobacter sp. IOR34 TaxID=3057176 RepID=UPI0025B09AAF|nr:energy transducer TonB [Thiohalobacter sp. IOR34]WJW75786.1 energy transducer TonB [Thiohalobacter sp. IOR34]